MLYSDNIVGLSIAFCVLGLFILPMLPAVLENCAECTYPVPEEFSTGLLFAGGNYFGIPFVFLTEYLIGLPTWGNHVCCYDDCTRLVAMMTALALLL